MRALRDRPTCDERVEISLALHITSALAHGNNLEVTDTSWLPGSEISGVVAAAAELGTKTQSIDNSEWLEVMVDDA